MNMACYLLKKLFESCDDKSYLCWMAYGQDA